MKNSVTNIALFPFDSDANDLDKTNMFYNQPALVVDYHFHDPCGTDCLVAYLYDSEEDAKQKLNDAFEDCKAYANSIDQQFEIDHPFFLILPEEKQNLRPDSVASAQALLAAQTKDTTSSIAYNIKKKSERDEWVVFSHAPYMYEKLGRISANCAPLLNK
jgi:hypothetical protein